MFAENPVLTAKRFVSSPSWRNADPNRLSEEIKSVFNETHRQADDLAFVVKDGGLIDPATGKPFDFKRSTPVEIAEGNVWDDLKLWANKNKKGKAVWLSPMLIGNVYEFNGVLLTTEGLYPANKAIIYEINWTNDIPPQKILQSTTILFDAPKNYCLRIAEKLNPLMKNVNDPEFLRGHLFRKSADFSLIEILEMISGDKKETTQTPSQETIEYFVKEIKSGRNAASIVQEMKAMGIIGEYSISCPLSYNSKILNFSKKEIGYWHTGDCVVPLPYCGKKGVEVGPCNICKDCEKKFDENPNYASEVAEAA